MNKFFEKKSLGFSVYISFLISILPAILGIFGKFPNGEFGKVEPVALLAISAFTIFFATLQTIGVYFSLDKFKQEDYDDLDRSRAVKVAVAFGWVAAIVCWSFLESMRWGFIVYSVVGILMYFPAAAYFLQRREKNNQQTN